ncbi:IgGFc-binding protein-like [Parambassis ranga]|uniref:IgGFc-binding protein-like n=1 Tax=Parambassis ranga TaxID=210632 RepID=A0A6P7JZV5_9TELE|nr:IgGFc-binding protein-like [Parambassis ranga]
MATVSSYLQVINSTWQEIVSLTGGVTKVIPVVTTDIIRVTNDAPLQVVYFTHENGKHPSALTMVPSVDDICQAKHMFVPHDATEWLDVFQDASSAHLSDDSPPPSIGRHLCLINKALQKLYSEECEKTAAACDDLYCAPKRKCSISNGKPLCSLKTKICSAWGGLFYRTFDGQDFILQGNCNYTLVQTTCPGLNGSGPLQINIARAYLNGVSTIHTVQINILGLNISIVKDDKNHVRVDGLKMNLPLILSYGSVTLYPSGSSVVLDTIFGLSLQYDWKHHVQIVVSMELYGAVCGLCGNADHSSSGSPIASNATYKSQAIDFTLPLVDSATGSGVEDCGGLSCALCSLSQTKGYPGANGDTFGTRCSLLQQRGGPFADCHSYVDPEPFVRSCVDSLCIYALLLQCARC